MKKFMNVLGEVLAGIWAISFGTMIGTGIINILQLAHIITFDDTATTIKVLDLSIESLGLWMILTAIFMIWAQIEEKIDQVNEMLNSL